MNYNLLSALYPVSHVRKAHKKCDEKCSRYYYYPPRICHQCILCSESTLPHEITSTGSPIPMKLKVDSATIAALTFMTTINIIDGIKFGTRCLRSMYPKPPPIHFAAMTYSLFFSFLLLCGRSLRYCTSL